MSKRFATSGLFAMLSLAAAGMASAQDLNFDNCPISPPPHEFAATFPGAFNASIGALNSSGGDIYLDFDANPRPLDGVVTCMGESPAFTCNGIEVRLPAVTNTPVSPAARVNLSGTSTGAGTFNFRIIATETGGAQRSCTREYRVRMVAVADTVPPTAPATLTAAIKQDQKTILLSWLPSTDNVGVVSYEVQVPSGLVMPEFKTLISVPGTSAEDCPAFPNREYRYRVRALDAAGNASAFSNEVRITSMVVCSKVPKPPVLTIG